MEEYRPRYVEVVGDRVEMMKLMHTIGRGVGERILLRVDGAGLDGRDRFGQIPAQWDGAQKLERPCLHLARQHADTHALKVRRRAHAPQPVRNMPKAILEIAEDAVIHAFLDLGRKEMTKRAVDGGARAIPVVEQKRQI